ncbi:MAG: M28 family peptidase [Acidobacteriota bacterium]
MRLRSSRPATEPAADDALTRLLGDVSEESLRELVEALAVPRHYTWEAEANRAVAQHVMRELESCGLSVVRQGEHDNLVATFGTDGLAEARVLIGAHFDSVPGSPGADDNASAVAGLLVAARMLARFDRPPVAFIAFNREEDGLLGSMDFVERCVPSACPRLELVHVLEMIGYCDHSPGSQQAPAGLPVVIGDRADFLAVVANRDSASVVRPLLDLVPQRVPELPVKVLQVHLGLEHHFPDILRSDHAPFWVARVPALMWTDTADFRNPHYHEASDLPDTLDYTFLARVTRLLVAQVVEHLGLRVDDGDGEG